MANASEVRNNSILLQSRDHVELLDVIDLLRSQGISNYVPLPQLIVCGDQSSGKSSVLEAVSGVRFPMKDNLCTRFATELILRRAPGISVTATIYPGLDRSEEQRVALSKFTFPASDLGDVPAVIEAAKSVMGLDTDTKAFTDDVLRIEICGPKQPYLTLVDLPGLIHAENRQQSAEDIELVSSLVRKYMASTRSIILAVVSARNDYANQIVTKFAREVDPKGLRTLGIITKPDTLPEGSDSEKSFVNLARNEDVDFRLGWHVLRNRDYSERDLSGDERNRLEQKFFSQGIWKGLPRTWVGATSLKFRLSSLLRDQILKELPVLMSDIELGITESHSRLGKLGSPRGTLFEQRTYLLRIGQHFFSTVEAATGGVYVQEFFGDAITKAGFSKRLRATVQSMLSHFAEEMSSYGQDRLITNSALDDEENSENLHISRSDFLLEVRDLMRRTKGRELPGTFNPLIIGDLFYQHAKPWGGIVEKFSGMIYEAVKLSLGMVLLHVTDENTRAGLQREIIDPAIEKFWTFMQEKTREILKPHQKGHPITYNHYFTETVQKARREHEEQQLKARLNKFFKVKSTATSSYLANQSFEIRDLLQALVHTDERDMELFACSEATFCMEAYYKV